ncbi:hypothetical protein ATM17_13235 [Sphingopyxis macrogoltabida]|uniref:Uncharacterized protein n=1 Tax=Sphingopyxis macrogoltabida TaxID=33050 RepID=A0AAC9FFN3_SPHMC|nr:hypothetical protein ATM17_13235 [Sphingopyxis macrogoltabida]
MNPVATSDAAFRGGACPTPEYTIAYTGNYTTSADANLGDLRVTLRAQGHCLVTIEQALRVILLLFAAQFFQFLTAEGM